MPPDPLGTLRAHAFELAGMAKSGLHFTDNEYDRARYERILAIGEDLAGLTFPDGLPRDREFIADVGLVTPKTGCNVAALDGDGRMLLIRRADNGRWALPGGYADIGATPAQNALRELHEETGFTGEIERLLGVFDNRAYGSTLPYQFYILLFGARLLGGAARTSGETVEVAFFGRDDLPPEIAPTQRAMIEHAFAGGDVAHWQ